MHDPAEREAERERDAARHAERSARPPEPAQPCFKKPRGRAPLAEGKPCSWNSDDGFWTTANGCYHDVAAVRKASKTEHFQRSKRIDVEAFSSNARRPGSRMKQRARRVPKWRRRPRRLRARAERRRRPPRRDDPTTTNPVSYTHLTLPTICSV